VGMSAEIIAIGPFDAVLLPFYEHMPHQFASVTADTRVVTRLFQIYEGSSVSTAFAALLGIDDPYDVSQHTIDRTRIDFPGLRTFLATQPGWTDDYAHDLDALEAFSVRGHDLHFLPNY
jgi:hypothetical protein